MSSQIYLLTGENLFLLREERSRWIHGFAEKHGEENLTRADGKGLKVSELFDLIASAPFIAEKRLVVIEGVPKCEKEDIRRIPDIIHPQVILLFVDPSPDKRLGAVKALTDIADVKQCKAVTGKTLSSWMDVYVVLQGTTMDPRAREELIAIVGEDQETLARELEKLALYATDRMITAQDVHDMAVPAGEQSIWKLLDFLAAGRVDAALSFARRLQERGESPHSLWNMLLWGTSNLPLVVAAVESGNRNPAAIAKEMKVSFGAVRSLLPLAQKIDRAGVRRIIDTFADADIALKTGGYRATAEAPEELEAVLDRCMMTFAPAYRQAGLRSDRGDS